LKLVWLWVLWLAVYLGQSYAGDWYYDGAGNFYNAALSYLIAGAVLTSYRTWWAKSYSLIAIFQIVLNFLDAGWHLPDYWFNITATAFNVLEFITLFIIGGTMTLEQWHDATSRGSGGANSRRLDGR